jgi:hypothetical protein
MQTTVGTWGYEQQEKTVVSLDLRSESKSYMNEECQLVTNTQRRHTRSTRMSMTQARHTITDRRPHYIAPAENRSIPCVRSNPTLYARGDHPGRSPYQVPPPRRCLPIPCACASAVSETRTGHGPPQVQLSPLPLPRPPARRDDARGPPDHNQLKRHGPYAPVFSPAFSTDATGAATPRTSVRSGPRRTQLALSSVCWCDATPEYRSWLPATRPDASRASCSRIRPSPMRGRAREPCSASAAVVAGPAVTLNEGARHDRTGGESVPCMYE